MEISRTIAEKAQRLVDEENIHRVKGGAYIVKGDSGNFYSVWVADADNVAGNCECPSTAAVCSHILAAAIYHLAFPPEPVEKTVKDPFVGLTY